MRKYSLLSLAFLLAACTMQGQVAKFPQKDGDVAPYNYYCAQGAIRVEYARMSGQDSATVSFSDAQEQALRKVLPRVGEYAFALDEWQWSAANDGRIYTLQHNGQILLDQCQSAGGGAFSSKEDHQGTVQLNLGHLFAK